MMDYKYHPVVWMVVSVFAGIQGWLMVNMVDAGVIEPTTTVSIIGWSLLLIIGLSVVVGSLPSVKVILENVGGSA